LQQVVGGLCITPVLPSSPTILRRTDELATPGGSGDNEYFCRVFLAETMLLALLLLLLLFL